MKKFLVLFVLALAGCSISSDDFGGLSELDIDFIQPTKWNGVEIPASQLCRQEGGHGATPPLYVTDIPSETNLIILEINNDDIPDLATAGLGSIGFYHKGDSSAGLLPVEGETFSMPSFAFEEKASRVYSAHPYPYMPPCKAKGYHYSATVLAVKRTGSFDKQKTEILAIGRIDLGRH